MLKTDSENNILRTHIFICLHRYSGSTLPLEGQWSFLHTPMDTRKEHWDVSVSTKSHWLIGIALLSTVKPTMTHWPAFAAVMRVDLTARMNKTVSEPILFSDNTFHVLFFSLIMSWICFLLVLLLFSLKINNVENMTIYMLQECWIREIFIKTWKNNKV